jgi:allantoinase
LRPVPKSLNIISITILKKQRDTGNSAHTMNKLPTEHSYYRNSPITKREPFEWPEGATVAVAFVVCLETYEVEPPPDAFVPVNVPGGFGRAPYPDMRAFSVRDYGPRVGIHRVIDALEACGLKATAAIDARLAVSYPSLVDTIGQLNWDIIGHGWALTQVISSQMPQSAEFQYIQSSLSALRKSAGANVHGWHSPEYGESRITPALLAQNGIRYVLDWPNDEQPYRMETSNGTLMSLPLLAELDDVFCHWHRKVPMDRWARSVVDALDQMEADGKRGGRMLLLNIHPWLIGQPWRITFFREVLKNIRARKNLWLTTTDQIASWAEKVL